MKIFRQMSRNLIELNTVCYPNSTRFYMAHRPSEERVNHTLLKYLVFELNEIFRAN